MARLKKEKVYKDKFIGFRCTELQYNEMQIKANLYTDGNLSEFVLYAAKNFEVVISDLDPEYYKDSLDAILQKKN